MLNESSGGVVVLSLSMIKGAFMRNRLFFVVRLIASALLLNCPVRLPGQAKVPVAGRHVCKAEVRKAAVHLIEASPMSLNSPDGPPDLGDQLPVQTESGPVPTHHRFGRDHNEGLLPSGPKSTNGDPEELVEQV